MKQELIKVQNNQADTNIKKKLLLPMPERLMPRLETCSDGALPVGTLAGFLADGLKDGVAIENWITAQAVVVTAFPLRAEKSQLSSRQQIYDEYFDVGRHGGTVASMTFALGQVMGELSREFQLGSGLGEQEINRLLDGLSAVLESVSER